MKRGKEKIDNYEWMGIKVTKIYKFDLIHYYAGKWKERLFELLPGIKDQLLSELYLVNSKTIKTVYGNNETGGDAEAKNTQQTFIVYDTGLEILDRVGEIKIALNARSSVAQTHLLISLHASKISSAKGTIESGDVIFSKEVTAFRKREEESSSWSIVRIGKKCSEFGKCMFISIRRNETETQSYLSGKIKILFSEAGGTLSLDDDESGIREIIARSESPNDELDKETMLAALEESLDKFIGEIYDDEKKILFYYHLKGYKKSEIDKILNKTVNPATISRTGGKLRKFIEEIPEMKSFIYDNQEEFIEILRKKLGKFIKGL